MAAGMGLFKTSHRIWALARRNPCIIESMKFAVSLALLVLLLGMPLSCLLAACPVPAPHHPCCPRTANFKCPYDTLDSAKLTSIAAIVPLPVADVTAIAPQITSVPLDAAPSIIQDRGDLYILNRILRI